MRNNSKKSAELFNSSKVLIMSSMEKSEMDYIDPGCECDAPMFVDFDNLNSHLDDGADTWFDNHDDHDISSLDSVAVKPEVVKPEVEVAKPKPEVEVVKPEAETKNTAKNLVGIFTSGISESNMRAPRVAAKKAAASISEMRKKGKGKGRQHQTTKLPTTKPTPFKFALDKRPALRSGGDTSAGRNVPMAEFVAKYQTATPPRFRSTPTHSKPPATTAASSGVNYSLGSSITIPRTPNLLSRARARPVSQKSAAEQEEELVAKMKQYRFKAKPLDPNIIKLGGLLGVPRKRTNANLTQPVSPQLATKKLAMARRAQGGEAADEMPDYDGDRRFVAQPLPNFTEISGLPPKLKRPATVPVSPAVLKRRRLNETEEEPHNSHLIKATAMPSFDNVFAPQYPQRMLIPKPFSFEERDKKKESKEMLVQRILKEEQKSTSFKAQPLPSTTFQPSQLPKASSSVTAQEPFTLHTELRGEEHALKWKEKVENQFDEETKKTNFKASGVPNMYSKPFAPKKSTKPLTCVHNVVMHSELRSSQRAKFDNEKLQRALATEKENLQRRALREAKEAKEIAAFRKTLVHKAQPIGYQIHTSQ